jgi:hypothetical protein
MWLVIILAFDRYLVPSIINVFFNTKNRTTAANTTAATTTTTTTSKTPPTFAVRFDNEAVIQSCIVSPPTESFISRNLLDKIPHIKFAQDFQPAYNADFTVEKHTRVYLTFTIDRLNTGQQQQQQRTYMHALNIVEEPGVMALGFDFLCKYNIFNLRFLFNKEPLAGRPSPN